MAISTGAAAGDAGAKRLKDITDRRTREQLERGLDLGLEAAPSVQDRTISLFSRGQQPAFAGINTFIKAPYCENIRDVGKYDVAVVGAPFDMGTTYRAGCRFGPRRCGGSRRCTTPTTPTWASISTRSSTSATPATSS